MKPQGNPAQDERRNYDRVNLTRGLLAAGLAGNADAYGILRRFYDWLNASPYALGLMAGPHMGSSHNCNNGHAGWPMLYLSPAGKPADLVMAERVFVQDFFLDQARRAEPLVLGYYPLHTPHSYVLLAFESWLDHYRATGAAKYLEASQGAWKIVHGSYEHTGGTIAICEEGQGTYPPGSLLLHRHTGETCGSVFWADFNHRFLQLYPDREQYAAELEQVIYNVILATQAANGSIRYHNHLDGAKEGPQCANTCCEVMGVPFIARLPQYLYSVAADGLWVNLFAASSIAWKQAGADLTLKTETRFPLDGSVTMTVKAPHATPMKLRIRVPAWAQGEVTIRVNGQPAGTGKPGTYAVLDRTWADQDKVSLELPLSFRLIEYTGLEQDPARARYALMYGPLLMALVGGAGLDASSSELPGRLTPVPEKALQFSVAGQPGLSFVPYWQIQNEHFTCFSTLR